MREIDTRCEIGKYYAVYKKANDKFKFKNFFIYRYDGFFTDIWRSFHILYGYNGVILSTTPSTLDADEIVSFELSEEEIYIHFTMEEIAQNL